MTGRGVGREKWDDIEALIRRVAERRLEMGMSIRGLATKAGMDPTALSRLERGERIPEVRTLIGLARALGMSLESLMGEEVSENGEPGVLTEAAKTMTLLGFLSEVQSRGLARWAATAPREQTPTLAEAAKALHVLHASPQYSTSDGAPIDGWGAYLTELRASGFRMPTPSKRSPKAAQAEEDALRDDLGERSTTGALTATPPKGRKK